MWVILVVAVIVISIIGVCVAPCSQKLRHKAGEHLTCCGCFKTRHQRQQESIRKSQAKNPVQLEEGQLVETTAQLQ